MKVTEEIQRLRDWFPVPQRDVGFDVVRWVLLEANRLAVTGALLTFVFVTIMVVGELWTFKMQRLLWETSAVQTVLATLLSGIILLVSIVVSINSIVLSHDITSVETQQNRTEGLMEFRRSVGELTESGESPTDPASFLDLMASVIHDRVTDLKEVAQGGDEEIAEEVEEYVESILGTVERLGGVSDVGGAEFGVLWLGLEVDYGSYMDRSRTLQSTHVDTSDEFSDKLDSLLQAFQLFATGKEYFKSLYYTKEVSQLSRVLLVVALPAILINSSAILAINSEMLPEIWVLGLPPLLTFVAVVFTISLAPFLVLTSYMLRLSTVARRTASTGPFSLNA